MKKAILLAFLLFSLPSLGYAWWNESWSFRKALTVDLSAMPKPEISDPKAKDVAVLVRLHAGNFPYFLDVKAGGADLRFVAADDVNPLSFHVEKFDPIAEIALIWVRLPVTAGVANSATPVEKIWMYYGNPEAVPGDDKAASYDVNMAAAYHLNESIGAPKDATAYANHPSFSSASYLAGSFIGGGLSFAEPSLLVIPASPSLRLQPETGWSFTTWMKLEAAQTNGHLLYWADGNNELALVVDGLALRASYRLGENTYVSQPEVNLLASQWHHLGVRILDNELTLYLDGNPIANMGAPFVALEAALNLGAIKEGEGQLIATLDELQISKVAREPSWFSNAFESQRINSAQLTYGGDETNSSGGESYFVTILQNVSVDGWVVIASLGVMAAVSWLVIFNKAVVISAQAKSNRLFLRDFRALDPQQPDALDRAPTDADMEAEDSPFLSSLLGDDDHHQNSPMYRIYHAGIQQLKLRTTGRAVGAQANNTLSSQSVGVVKAALDGALTREVQRLNKLMVLLTIAISGGPFLGLLGTVMGVMITFASIAASGDVNINAIAPGVSAALMTTVAGLAVAIPALFAYNYLASRIREISVDMRLFVDEFVARVAEYHS